MLKPFNSHYSIESVPTIYDEEALTVLQLCGRLAGKLNEAINQVNKDTENIAEVDRKQGNFNAHLEGIAKTLETLVVEPLGYATPQMFGATGDGVADDTQAIKSAINALGDTASVLFFPAGTYLVTEDIELKSNITVRGTGAESIIKRAPNALNNYRVFRCRSVSSVCITDLTIQGDRHTHTGNTGEWGMVVSLEGANNVTIERCTLAGGWGDGVYIGIDDTTLEPCNTITVRDCTIDDNRRNGISVISVDGLILDACQVTNTKGTLPEAGIDFEPNTAGQAVRNVMVTNCTFAGNNSDVLFADTTSNTNFDATVLVVGCMFNSKIGLDWRTPLAETGTGFVRFKNCTYDNATRCARMTKGTTGKQVSFDACDFSSSSICVELGESGKDYGTGTIGGVNFNGCHIHANGENPVVRGAGSNVKFDSIVLDIGVNPAIQAYAYFAQTPTNLVLNFHEGGYTMDKNTEFDKYRITSHIKVDTTTANRNVLFKNTFPKYLPVVVSNYVGDADANVFYDGAEIHNSVGYVGKALLTDTGLIYYGGL